MLLLITVCSPAVPGLRGYVVLNEVKDLLVKKADPSRVTLRMPQPWLGSLKD
jgi:hypothetical protein